MPNFAEALAKIASSQKLSFEVWGIDPEAMPPTKAVGADLAPRLSQMAMAMTLSQESWSESPHFFAVKFSRPVGSRSAHLNVTMPSRDSADGVFFFTYTGRLYVWPKAQMDAAVIQMLRRAELIDDPG